MVGALWGCWMSSDIRTDAGGQLVLVVLAAGAGAVVVVFLALLVGAGWEAGSGT